MKKGTWETKDIALGAYVLMRAKRDENLGVRLVKIERNGRDSTYVFSDRDGRVDEITVDFAHSESFEFDAQVRVLKSIGHSKNGGSGGRR
jgi:hypothetical protein